MSKLIIICEGQTEELFCNRILKPHFAAFNIDIAHPLIVHSGGGIVKWIFLKKQIEQHHTDEPDAFITTFIDYYGMKEVHGFPDWALAQVEVDKPTAMNILESGMKADLSPATATQFVPYIQLHEFEALVLSDEAAFGTYYEPREYDAVQIATLCAAAPETVNDGLTTAPSKRLKRAIRGYDKVNDGFELTNLAGLPAIRNRCPRFNNWITALEGI